MRFLLATLCDSLPCNWLLYSIRNWLQPRVSRCTLVFQKCFISLRLDSDGFDSVRFFLSKLCCYAAHLRGRVVRSCSFSDESILFTRLVKGWQDMHQPRN